MKAYAQEHGVDFEVLYYDQNIATEANLIENAVQSGVKVLIVHNQSEGDCVDSINAAVDAGVTVLLYATDVPEAHYTLLYTEDSYYAGQKMGEMAVAWAQENLVGKGKPDGLGRNRAASVYPKGRTTLGRATMPGEDDGHSEPQRCHARNLGDFGCRRARCGALRGRPREDD